jgi:hypothetical protein
MRFIVLMKNITAVWEDAKPERKVACRVKVGFFYGFHAKTQGSKAAKLYW